VFELFARDRIASNQITIGVSFFFLGILDQQADQTLHQKDQNLSHHYLN